MQLKASLDYGIRAVLYLAAKNTVCSSKEIADEMAIPRDYLIQLAQQLRNSGLIEAKPGKNGGYCLSREANAISVYDVMSALGESMNCLRACEAEGGKLAKELRHVYGVVEESREACLKAATLDCLVACVSGESASVSFLADSLEHEVKRLREKE